MPPIAVLIVGRSAEVARELVPLLAPEIDVVHFISSPTVAKQEIPLVVAGQRCAAESGVGTNIARLSTSTSTSTETETAPVIPRIVLVGGGFGEDVYASIRSSVGEFPAESGVIWGRERREDIEGLEDEGNWDERFGFRNPKPEVLAVSIKKVLVGMARGEEKYTSRRPIV